MSYWPPASSSAAEPVGPFYSAPPLPPRNNGPDAVPPPIPPRPAGFGYQPVRNHGLSETPTQSNGSSAEAQRKPITSNSAQAANSHLLDSHTVVPEQSATTQGGQYQYPSHPSIPPTSAQGYSDVSHLFPDGKIPPPPPRLPPPGASASPQPLLNANKPNTVVSPAVARPQISINNKAPRAYSKGSEWQNQEQSSSTQPTPASGNDWEHTAGTKVFATNTTSYNIGNDGAGVTSAAPEATRLSANNDMATVNEGFQTMRLGNPGRETPLSTEDSNNSKYRAYSPQQASSPAPAIPAKIPLPTPQSPNHRSPTPGTSSATSPRQPQSAGRECISSNVTFAATWYTHRLAPEFPICMNCYENHIHSSRFKAEFQGAFLDDGKVRACAFNSTRIKERLWKLALSSGSLDGLIEYMVLRPSLPGCAGQGGAKGDVGIKWYRARNNAIPEMVVCQTCYEDHILAYPEFAREHFELSTIPQAADQTWWCDLVVPYIYREYKVRALTNDWKNFVECVPVRMSLKPCPGSDTVYPQDNKWFTPINGPKGLLICMACYCDYVLLTEQHSQWRNAGDNLVGIFGVSVSCFFGAQFSVRALAARMLDTNDYTAFWKAMDIIVREPPCKGQMKNGTWYTLHSDPASFEICRICYVAIAEPMGIGHHFKPKAGIAPGSSIMCSFNPGVARFPVYMQNLLEMVYKQDPTPLEEFVKEYACLPVCSRDTHVKNSRWFGWNECTICAECHHDFIRGTALADSMPHQGVLVQDPVMCDMYSPRMRQLYQEACASNPPDPKPLLEYSVHRSAVWAETMPRARQINTDLRLKILQQRDAARNSLFYTSTGNLFYRTLPLEQTYGSSAIGYGHYNHMQIKGAEYSRQAAAIGNEIRGAPAYIADELVRRWRLVE